ncbi:MAG: fibronectin type III domain-containing protein [Clostridiales bacterium]|nr:fibronectin type III domain-containing protein [Clostridiales bacterium]
MKKNIFTNHKLQHAFFAPLLASFLLCSCSEMFESRVDMQLGTSTGTLSDLLKSAKEIEKLDAPANIYVTNGQYSNKIVISWEKVQNATSYRLERAVSSTKDDNGNWVLPDDSAYDFLEHSKYIYSTSYTDTIIDDSASNPLDYTNEAYGQVYFYRVCAENITKGYESSDTCPITDPGSQDAPNKNYSAAKVRAAMGTLLTPPSNVRADCGESTTKITVHWTKAPGDIGSYEVYRSSSSDGSGGTRIGIITGNEDKFTSYVSPEQQGLNYYFSIYSVAKNGQKSAASPIAMGYALQAGAPSRVNSVTVTNGRGNTKDKISIDWRQASGESTVYYNVFRSSSEDSTLKQLSLGNNYTANSCEDGDSLKPNVFYYYQVQSYIIKSGEIIQGAMSVSGSDAEITSTTGPAEGYIIGPPKSISVNKNKNDNSLCDITFSAGLGSAECSDNSSYTNTKRDYNTYTYVISYCETATGEFTPLTPTTGPTISSPGFYTATVASHKFYKIKTVNGSVSSIDSPVVAASPSEATNFTATKNAAINGYTNDDTKANANGVHAITLSWSAPVGGADGGYNVYRSTKMDSGYRKVNESPITETTYTFVDASAKAGNYYYYRVLSLNSLGQGSNYSTPDYGYGALTTYQYLREYIKTTLNSQKKLTLMHKSGNTAKLGSESANGEISGSLSYEASIAGLGGRVIMHYTNYADYYIMNNKDLGVYFLLDGNTNTSASMDTNGTMDGTVTVRGMYPGKVVYDGIKIKGGAAGGGTYGVTRNGIDSSAVQADWTWGEK